MKRVFLLVGLFILSQSSCFSMQAISTCSKLGIIRAQVKPSIEDIIKALKDPFLSELSNMPIVEYNGVKLVSCNKYLFNLDEESIKEINQDKYLCAMAYDKKKGLWFKFLIIGLNEKD